MTSDGPRMTPSDRRRRRSRQTLRAIHLQLQAVAERLGAVAVWVADADGLLLGASESDIEGDVLAAYSSIPRCLEALPGAQMGMVAAMDELKGTSVTFKPFEVDGQSFSLGIARPPRHTDDDTDDRGEVGDEAGRAITGVVRILAEGVVEP